MRQTTYNCKPLLNQEHVIIPNVILLAFGDKVIVQIIEVEIAIPAIISILIINDIQYQPIYEYFGRPMPDLTKHAKSLNPQCGHLCSIVQSFLNPEMATKTPPSSG